MHRRPALLLIASSFCLGQVNSLPRFGLGVTAGTAGIGVEAATAVTRRSNVRFGFNYFSHGIDASKDGIAYDGTLRLESAELLYDQFLVSSFHISGGLMVYDGNQGTAAARIPAGQAFTLNGQRYYSAAADPVRGAASITTRSIAPEVLAGFGNLLPRSARHFSLGVEGGVAFQGSPNAKLNLNGSACVLGPASGCVPIDSNPVVQSNIVGEQSRINSSLTGFRYYPVLRLIFGYKF